MDKWFIREADGGEPSTSASGHLTSENVSATTSATSTTENKILVLEVVQLENLAVERRENTKKPFLNMDLLIPLSTASSAHSV
jgi:hypothetical protein